MFSCTPKKKKKKKKEKHATQANFSFIT